MATASTGPASSSRRRTCGCAAWNAATAGTTIDGQPKRTSPGAAHRRARVALQRGDLLGHRRLRVVERIPHVYVVTSETPARWLATSTGHQFASFAEALSTPAAEPTLPTDVEIDPAHAAAVAARHGIELLAAPGMLPRASSSSPRRELRDD
jgi:hypothetical protein